jgi:hypothetical protein
MFQKDKYFLLINYDWNREKIFIKQKRRKKIDKKSEIKNAVNQIINFALEHNLKITPVRGKIIEYLKRKRPKYYKALVSNKVVEDFWFKIKKEF